MKDRCLTVRGTAEKVEISTSSTHAVLCDHAQSGCEICSQSSVGGTENTPFCSCTWPTEFAPCDFWLFPKIKMASKGSLFQIRVQYFVRGFVGHRSRASSKHLSSHLPVDGVGFLGGQKGVALQLQDVRVGVGSNKDADHSRCSEK
ncbi:uncharacterized protein TNCV_1048001 [Trichonephila clavipes]|nr:uncharacterized protein TNCV_1048001 [Trichonephila clavipes]